MILAKKIRLFFIILLIVASLLDIITTLMDPRMLVFEINFVYLLTGSVYIIILAKLLVISVISYCLYNGDKLSYTLQFFYVMMTILLIIVQVTVAHNNFHVVKEFKNVPTEQLEDYALPKGEAVQKYNYNIVLKLYLPLILSLFCFKVWELSFLRKV